MTKLSYIGHIRSKGIFFRRTVCMHNHMIVLYVQNYKVLDVVVIVLNLWWINWCVGISSPSSEEKWGLLDTSNLFLRSKKSKKINNVCFVKSRCKHSSNTLLSLLRIFMNQTLCRKCGSWYICLLICEREPSQLAIRTIRS